MARLLTCVVLAQTNLGDISNALQGLDSILNAHSTASTSNVEFGVAADVHLAVLYRPPDRFPEVIRVKLRLDFELKVQRGPVNRSEDAGHEVLIRLDTFFDTHLQATEHDGD